MQEVFSFTICEWQSREVVHRPMSRRLLDRGEVLARDHGKFTENLGVCFLQRCCQLLCCDVL